MVRFFVIPSVIVMSKIRLFIKSRKTGSRIESVPLQKLVKLANFKQRRWEFEPNEDGGWLTLEAR